MLKVVYRCMYDVKGSLWGGGGAGGGILNVTYSVYHVKSSLQVRVCVMLVVAYSACDVKSSLQVCVCV